VAFYSGVLRVVIANM